MLFVNMFFCVLLIFTIFKVEHAASVLGQRKGLLQQHRSPDLPQSRKPLLQVGLLIGCPNAQCLHCHECPQVQGDRVLCNAKARQQGGVGLSLVQEEDRGGGGGQGWHHLWNQPDVGQQTKPQGGSAEYQKSWRQQWNNRAGADSNRTATRGDHSEGPGKRPARFPQWSGGAAQGSWGGDGGAQALVHQGGHRHLPGFAACWH